MAVPCYWIISFSCWFFCLKVCVFNLIFVWNEIDDNDYCCIKGKKTGKHNFVGVRTTIMVWEKEICRFWSCSDNLRIKCSFKREKNKIRCSFRDEKVKRRMREEHVLMRWLLITPLISHYNNYSHLIHSPRLYSLKKRHES